MSESRVKGAVPAAWVGRDLFDEWLGSSAGRAALADARARQHEAKPDVFAYENIEHNMVMTAACKALQVELDAEYDAEVASSTPEDRPLPVYRYEVDYRYEYMDNERVVFLDRVGADEAAVEYLMARDRGCCGGMDLLLFVRGERVLVGFNYGH